MPLYATVVESAGVEIWRNTVSAVLAALIIAIIGLIWRYGKRINENYHTLINKLEGNDGAFAQKLEDHEKLDIANDAETKRQLASNKSDTDRRLTDQDTHLLNIERSQKVQAKQTKSAIQSAQKAATQATIAATEATTAAKLATAATDEIKGQLGTLIKKVDGLPQVS